MAQRNEEESKQCWDENEGKLSVAQRNEEENKLCWDENE